MSLLTIPGEIRNRIYEFAVCDSVDTPVDRTHWQYASRKEWYEYARPFRGLTETCRQLRSEFLPIHQARVKVSIRLMDIEQYCQHVLKHQQSALVRITTECWVGRATDITELVRVVNLNPGVELTPYTLYMGDNNELSDVIKQGQFLRNIVEQTDKVMLTNTSLKPGTRLTMKTSRMIMPTDGPKRKYGYLWLQVKPEYAEPWMAKSCGEWYTEEQMPKMWEWQIKLGLQFEVWGVRPYCTQPVGHSQLSAHS